MKEFIQKLRAIEEKSGDDAEVVMSDGIPVVEPVFGENNAADGRVVLTDRDWHKKKLPR